MLHEDANPILKASQSESMNEFIAEYEADLHAKFKSENLSKDEVLAFVQGDLPRDQYRKRKLTMKQY